MPKCSDIERRAFERGAWFAFDDILGWINTFDEQSIDKADLYRRVMSRLPMQIADYFDRKAEENA